MQVRLYHRRLQETCQDKHRACAPSGGNRGNRKLCMREVKELVTPNIPCKGTRENHCFRRQVPHKGDRYNMVLNRSGETNWAVTFLHMLGFGCGLDVSRLPGLVR